MSMNLADFVDQTTELLTQAGYTFYQSPELGDNRWTFDYTDADGDIEHGASFGSELEAQAGALAHFFDMAWTFIER